jgi:UDP-N-acetylglucosamine 4-epimerase
LLALTSENPKAINEVYNTAFGARATLNDLIGALKENLGVFDPKIREVEVIHGPNRVGDIPHSLASIEKAQKLLGYNPKFSLQEGLKEAVSWYWEHLKK